MGCFLESGLHVPTRMGLFSETWGASCNPVWGAETDSMTIKGRDARPTLTLKGEGFTPEFRALLNKAAKKAGKTQAEFAADVLAAASRRVLSGSNPDDNPPDNPPPATIQQIDDMRVAMRAADAKTEETARMVERLAEQVQKLAEAQAAAPEQRGLWARLKGR